MYISFLNKVVAGTLLTGSALGFNSCGTDSDLLADNRKEVVKELMADRPMKEYNKAIGGWREGILAAADAQSTIDSIAFRQVFDGTILSTDSESVKQFNSIAGKMRVENNYKSYEPAFKDLDNKMLDQNIKVKEIPANAKEYKALETPGVFGLFGNEENKHKVLAVRQFKADSLAYTNFFKEKGRLTPGIEKSISNISKKIKLKP